MSHSTSAHVPYQLQTTFNNLRDLLEVLARKLADTERELAFARTSCEAMEDQLAEFDTARVRVTTTQNLILKKMRRLHEEADAMPASDARNGRLLDLGMLTEEVNQLADVGDELRNAYTQISDSQDRVVDAIGESSRATGDAKDILVAAVKCLDELEGNISAAFGDDTPLERTTDSPDTAPADDVPTDTDTAPADFPPDTPADSPQPAFAPGRQVKYSVGRRQVVGTVVSISGTTAKIRTNTGKTISRSVGSLQIIPVDPPTLPTKATDDGPTASSPSDPPAAPEGQQRPVDGSHDSPLPSPRQSPAGATDWRTIGQQLGAHDIAAFLSGVVADGQTDVLRQLAESAFALLHDHDSAAA